MIPIPTLPTDNFYNFLTFFGVILTVIPFYLLQSYEEKFDGAALNWKKESDEVLKRIQTHEYASRQVDILAESLKYPTKQQRFVYAGSKILDDTVWSPESKNMLLTRIEYLDTTRQLIAIHLNKLVNKIEDNYAQMNMDTLNRVKPKTEYERLINSSNKIDGIGYVLIIAGFVFLIIGVYGWYMKQQIYQDKILKDQALSLPKPSV